MLELFETQTAKWAERLDPIGPDAKRTIWNNCGWTLHKSVKVAVNHKPKIYKTVTKTNFWIKENRFKYAKDCGSRVNELFQI